MKKAPKLRQSKSRFNVICPSNFSIKAAWGGNGFTLLEVLISLTIMGMILVVIFGSLRIGVRAWEKGERDVEAHQRQRIVLDLVKRQLASACAREVKTKDGDPFMLKGDDRSLVFISRFPVIPTTMAGMAYVQYKVREASEGPGELLAVFEKNIVFLGDDGDLEGLEEEDFFVLIPGMESIRFEYLKATDDDEGTQEWQEAWDPENDEGLPLAVKMTFQEDSETAPILVIARLAAGA